MTVRDSLEDEEQVMASMVDCGLRVLLTPKCNYRCYFCHNEGLDKTADKDSSIDPVIVESFVRYGVRDITLSGGEPLLEMKLISGLLTHLKATIDTDMLSSVKLTLVTNAVLLNSEILDTLKGLAEGFGGFKVNASLHSSDETAYNEVTKTQNRFDHVRDNIRNAVDAGVNISLNYVLLNGRNTGDRDIENMLSLASELGVKRVKLIEFLVTQQNRKFFPDLFRLESLLYNYKHRASRIMRKSARSTSYTFEKEGITIDLNRCSCALGCLECARTREIELIPGNRILPCIVHEDWAIEASDAPPEDVLRKSVRLLSRMVDKYGSYSPALSAPPENLSAKAIFNVTGGEKLEGLMDKDVIRLLRRYTRTSLVGPAGQPPASGYRFCIEQSYGDGHSRLRAYKEKRAEAGEISWVEVFYMDPVYDFSRTRDEVNWKKVACMGLEKSSESMIEEESVALTHPTEDGPRAYYIEYKDSQSGSMQSQLVVHLTGSESWPVGEPLDTARRVAGKFRLGLKPTGEDEE